MAKTKRAETFRLKRLCKIEQQVHSQGFNRIAGVDEAGRGPLAGPIVAAACILPPDYILREIDDSKKLTFEKRYSLYQELILQPEMQFGIGIVEAAEIDSINIHQATLKAMQQAVVRLQVKPDYLLVDGAHLPKMDIPGMSVVDGDRLVQVIAAASILAKVTRDHIMIGYHDLYPEYGFNEHKGYGTAQHLDAIAKYGPTPIHRMSFGLLKKVREEKSDEEHDRLCSSHQQTE